MFGIDFETLVILAILAFILFGPEKLPEYAAKLGYYIAKLRQASSDLSREYHASFPELLQPPSGPTPTQPLAAAADETPPHPANSAAATAAAYQSASAATPAPPGQPTCPQCATAVGVDFLFCPKCGLLLPRPPASGPSQPLAS